MRTTARSVGPQPWVTTVSRRDPSTAALFLTALALSAAIVATAPARAADVENPYDPPPGYGRLAPRPPGFVPPPPPGPGLAEGPVEETCRVFLRRRPGPFGEDELRRVRVCDEGPVARRGGPRWDREAAPPLHRGEYARPGPAPEPFDAEPGEE